MSKFMVSSKEEVHFIFIHMSEYTLLSLHSLSFFGGAFVDIKNFNIIF